MSLFSEGWEASRRIGDVHASQASLALSLRPRPALSGGVVSTGVVSTIGGLASNAILFGAPIYVGYRVGKTSGTGYGILAGVGTLPLSFLAALIVGLSIRD